MALQKYIEDDWNDNALSGRTSAEKDVFYQYSDGGTGDLLKGVYRPIWQTDAGTVTVSSGMAVFDATDAEQTISSPTRFTTGEWVVDMQYGSLGDTGNFHLFVVGSADPYNNALELSVTDLSEGSRVQVNKRDAGTFSHLLETSWPEDTALHTYRLTRTSYGDFEAFFDGTSYGTATDTFLPPIEQLSISNNHSQRTDVDNLQVS